MSFASALGLIGAWFVALLHWLHHSVVNRLVQVWDDWVIHTSEEWAKSVIRETFAQTARFINGVSALVVSFADGNYRESLRSSWQQEAGRHAWGREERDGLRCARAAVMHAIKRGWVGRAARCLGRVKAGASRMSPLAGRARNGPALGSWRTEYTACVKC